MRAVFLMFRYVFCFFFLSLILPSALLWSASFSYSVSFEGLQNPVILKSLRATSQLITLRKKEISSLNALRFRAELDAKELTHLVQGYGYLEAEISFEIKETFPSYTVILYIHPGPLYTFEGVHITLIPPTIEQAECDLALSNEHLGITTKTPAETKRLLNVELTATHALASCGFPFAEIKQREMIADGKTKQVSLYLTIDVGPQARFGPTTIYGNTSVLSSFIEKRLYWKIDELYNANLVEKTQSRLLDSSLFSSVFITHDQELTKEGELPMKIEVTETKHKSIGIGASYQTTYGPGLSFGWENRNVGGLGRKLRLEADIAQKTHSGIASYVLSEGLDKRQDYTFQAEALNENIVPYHDRSYSALARFDRQINQWLFLSAGTKEEYLVVKHSVKNDSYFLIEFPFFLRFATDQEGLDPGAGFRIDYVASFDLSITPQVAPYYSQTAHLCGYLPLGKVREKHPFCLLAQKLTLSSIASSSLDVVPIPKRCLGGSEENLRGYRYYTVSPLTSKQEPIGGRSAIYYTLEPRFRLSESIGIVPFFDFGNVWLSSWPTYRGKWLKSAGIGFRYFSIVGPLRFDLAFPLNRRAGIDPAFWIFVSFGQTF